MPSPTLHALLGLLLLYLCSTWLSSMSVRPRRNSPFSLEGLVVTVRSDGLQEVGEVSVNTTVLQGVNLRERRCRHRGRCPTVGSGDSISYENWIVSVP